MPKIKGKNSKLKIEVIALDKLKIDRDNARLHNERNIEVIKSSLVKYKQYQPLIVQKKTYKIIAGNGRYKAMQELEWEEVDCIVLDVNDKEARQIALIDNRTSELASWDKEKLVEFLDEIQKDDSLNIEDIGFNDVELGDLVKEVGDFYIEENSQEIEKITEEIKQETKKNKCPKCGYVF